MGEFALLEGATFLYEDSNAGFERRNLEVATAILIAGVVILVSTVVILEIAKACRRRRRALASSRLLNLEQSITGSRRALTDSSSLFEIDTMDVVAACGQNIPSFVCSLSTLALTEVITSQFCGGSSSLDSCSYNTQYALGYVASSLQSTMG